MSFSRNGTGRSDSGPVPVEDQIHAAMCPGVGVASGSRAANGLQSLLQANNQFLSLLPNGPRGGAEGGGSVPLPGALRNLPDNLSNLPDTVTRIPPLGGPQANGPHAVPRAKGTAGMPFICSCPARLAAAFS